MRIVVHAKSFVTRAENCSVFMSKREQNRSPRPFSTNIWSLSSGNDAYRHTYSSRGFKQREKKSSSTDHGSLSRTTYLAIGWSLDLITDPKMADTAGVCVCARAWASDGLWKILSGIHYSPLATWSPDEAKCISVPISATHLHTRPRLDHCLPSLWENDAKCARQLMTLDDKTIPIIAMKKCNKSKNKKVPDLTDTQAHTHKSHQVWLLTLIQPFTLRFVLSHFPRPIKMKDTVILAEKKMGENTQMFSASRNTSKMLILCYKNKKSIKKNPKKIRSN